MQHKTNLDLERFCGPPKVSEITGWSENYLANMRSAGKGIKFYRLNSGKIRYHLQDVEAFMASAVVGTLDQD